MHRPGHATAGAGKILSLIIGGKARSRKEIADMTGMSRGTVSQRLQSLFDAGLVHEATEMFQSGGRPARAIQFNPAFGTTLVADIGETHVRAALTDLEPKILADETGELEVGSGPEPVLSWIVEKFRELIKRVSLPASKVIGIGLSLPAPVDYEKGLVVGPSIMTGWDGFDICGYIANHFHAPVVADNDVNIMALAEYRRYWSGVDQMFFVKSGTGIGSGIIIDGKIYRGAQGAAGDIGHMRLGGHGDPLSGVAMSAALRPSPAVGLLQGIFGLLDSRPATDVMCLPLRNATSPKRFMPCGKPEGCSVMSSRIA